MAYMSFSPWEAAIPSTMPAATVEDAANFSALELRVIALGERSDIESEIAPESRTARFLERVFGIKPVHPLANPRLENLRRFASLARFHPDRLNDQAIATLRSSGFSAGQAYGLLGYYSDRRRGVSNAAAA